MFLIYFYITPAIIEMILWIILIHIEGPKPKYVKELFHPDMFYTNNKLINIDSITNYWYSVFNK